MRVNLVKADKIHLAVEQFQKILDFIMSNKDKYVNGKFKFVNPVFPVSEGQIIVKGLNATVYFKHRDGEIDVYFKGGGNSQPLIFTAEFSTNFVHFEEHPRDFTESELLGYSTQLIEMIVFISQYIADYKEVKERVSHKRVIITPNATNTNKKKSKRPIKVGVYYINDFSEQPQKAPFQRHVESWGVRGHWRVCKSGKRSWVRPHIKGEGTKEAREYTV